MPDDFNLVQDIFQKLEPPVPLASIYKAFRIEKNDKTKPRLLKVVLLTHNDVDRMSLPFICLYTISPDHISISRDGTQFERLVMCCVLDVTKAKLIVPSAALLVFPQIVPVTSHQ